MQSIHTKSAKETQAFAKDLAKVFKNGGILALSGELGAGKTTFAQGFAEGLGIKEKIISPTFLIIRQYLIPKRKKMFYHIDLYRLENINFVESGLAEILEDKENIVLIEWAEKIADKLPADTRKIHMKKTLGNLHEIHLTTNH